MNFIDELITYGNEGPCLDFKRTQYPIGKNTNRSEFLKDISSMLNHPSENDKYIIIGVIEQGGVATGFINVDDPIDQAKYQQILNKYLEPEVCFEYKMVIHKGYQLAVFRLYNNILRPYLFKCDVPNVDGCKLDFKTGDGYIRVGTSPRKMQRNDFELIYKNKSSSKDRKENVEVNLKIGPSTDEEVLATNALCLDLTIENKSNKSITLNISMAIKKNESFMLITEYEFLTAIDKEKAKKRTRGMLFPATNFPYFRNQNLRCTMQESPDCYTVTYNYPITILQTHSEPYIMDQNLILVIEKATIIGAVVTIRSDDFINGPLIKEFFIEVGSSE